jgi:predicted ferric reductase
MALTSTYLWYVTRATGLVTLILFSAVVALGTLVATRAGGAKVGRFELNEVHRSLSTVAMAFLVIHIVTTVVDSYVPTGWISAFVPMTSSYKRVDVALGAVAFDVVLAVWASSLLKARIANTSWRFIHWFSWVAVVVSLAHGFVTGTDSRSGIGLAVLIASALTVSSSALWRWMKRPQRALGRTAYSPLASAHVQPHERAR